MINISHIYKSVFYGKHGLDKIHYYLLRYSILNESSNWRRFPLRITGLDKMPKRKHSHSWSKSKLAKKSSSYNKRSPIPRSCKSLIGNVDFNNDSSLLIPPNKFRMGTNQLIKKNVEEDKQKSIKEEKSSWSSDEDLDVVYNAQEEKKNKIYEVITIMSDDETPNKITYERIYADEPDRLVTEIPPSSSKPAELGINNALSVLTQTRSCIISKIPSPSENMDVNVDSDDEIQCLNVLDKKKTEDISNVDAKKKERKDDVDVIYLSSDPESEENRPISPLRLKIPSYLNSYPILNSLDRTFCFGDDHTCDELSPPKQGLEENYSIYPFIITKKNSNLPVTFSDCVSNNSTSELLMSGSEPFLHINSHKEIVAEESCSSSEHLNQEPITYSGGEDSASSFDEEAEIYWKAHRESRRKIDLMYEEHTVFGEKLLQGGVQSDSNSSLNFKILSYNVLAQNLLEQHRYLYKNQDSRALVWSRRWNIIYQMIKDENADIVCLQEVEESYFESHYTQLKELGYKWVYKKRTKSYKDGVAVFYKEDIFVHDLSHKVEYYQPGVPVLDRDNVGVVVRLKLKSSNHAIVVATTHLLYNPKRSDIKLAQVQMLLAEIDRLALPSDPKVTSYCPVILTGDFNLKPNNGVYKFLTEGRFTYNGMSRKTLNSHSDRNQLSKILIPNYLGITDCCRHIEVLKAREKPDAKNALISTSTKIYHSEFNPIPDEEDCAGERFESGTLNHKFNFKSVYSHVKEDGSKEASTHHDKWVTVDYIFYSSEEDDEEDDDATCDRSILKLVSRNRLPTQDECENLIRHIPNFAFGSDHLPLVAKFFWRFHEPSTE